MKENEFEIAEEEEAVFASDSAGNDADVVQQDGSEVRRPFDLTADLYSWADWLINAFLIISVALTFFFRLSTVDGQSMLPTLDDKQGLIISMLGYEPAYNDIVVVWAENIPNDQGEIGKAIVKRVIGLPGDEINIDFTNGCVYRNGTQLPLQVKDGVLYEDGHMINSYTNNSEGRGNYFIVPDGHLFVMGDNRNASTDSRSTLVGDVDMRDLIGKAYLRVFPFDKISGLYQ